MKKKSKQQQPTPTQMIRPSPLSTNQIIAMVNANMLTPDEGAALVRRQQREVWQPHRRATEQDD